MTGNKALGFSLLAAAVLAAPPLRAAEGDPLELGWSVPPASGCPEASYAAAEVRRYVGPARPGRGPVSAKVIVQRTAAGEWELLLQTEQAGARGERRLRDVSCPALIDAAVVILAWMIDPEKMAARASETEPKHEPGPPPARPAPAVPPPQPAPRRRQLSVFASLAGALDSGSLPSVAPGGRARVGVALSRLRWATYASYFPQSRQQLVGPDGLTYGGDFRLLAIGAQSCFALQGARLGFEACLGPELNHLRGESFGVTQVGHGSKAWVSGVLELGGHTSLSRHLDVVLLASGIVPTLRESFAVHGRGVVHQPGPAALRLSLGLEGRL